jgi:hypothetical protein
MTHFRRGLNFDGNASPRSDLVLVFIPKSRMCGNRGSRDWLLLANATALTFESE